MLSAAPPTPELVRALFDYAPFPVWVFDRETLRFLAVNDEAVQRYGYSRQEFLARTILDIRPPEDAAEVRADVEAVRQQLPAAGFWRHLTASGQLIDVEIRRVAELTFEGRPARLVTARDVTDERRAVVALQNAERRFRAVLENGADALLFLSAEGTVLWASALAEHLLGQPAEQLIGRRGLDLVHPDDREVVRAARDATRARPGERVRSVARYAAAAGAPCRWLESVATDRLRDAAVGALVVHLRDVTEQRQAEEALRRSEESFRNAIEGAPDLVVVVRDGAVAYANAAVLAALGRARDEVVGRPVRDLVHPDDAAAAAALAVPGGAAAPGPQELRVRGASGAFAAVEFRAVAVEFSGAPAVLAFGRDLTERRRLEGRLAVADRLSSLGTLSAGIAHEINNPVAYALAGARFLADAVAPHLRAAPAEERREVEQALRDVRDGLERVRDIVRDLKAFSRGDDGPLGPVDLRAVLDAACGITASELRHRARVRRAGDEGPVWVHGDEGKLAQVFVNLLVNAAQAIPEGRAAENEVRIAVAARPGGQVVVEVRDTGAGIAPEHLPRLFDPFFTTKPKGVGTGLGLSVCDSIVRAHGGAIEVESAPGRGAAFRVVLCASGPGGAAGEER